MSKEPQDPDLYTGLPVLRTWRAVYAVVTVTFVVWIVLLTILTGHYS